MMAPATDPDSPTSPVPRKHDDEWSGARSMSMSSGSDNSRKALCGVNERDMERFAQDMEMFARHNTATYGAPNFTRGDAGQAYRNARGNPLNAIEQLYPQENAL